MHCNNHWDGLELQFEQYRQIMVGFSRVRIRVSVEIRVRFSFIGANLYIAMAPPNFNRPSYSAVTYTFVLQKHICLSRFTANISGCCDMCKTRLMKKTSSTKIVPTCRKPDV